MGSKFGVWVLCWSSYLALVKTKKTFDLISFSNEPFDSVHTMIISASSKHDLHKCHSSSE
jgi:hypothetical protein